MVLCMVSQGNGVVYDRKLNYFSVCLARGSKEWDSTVRLTSKSFDEHSPSSKPLSKSTKPRVSHYSILFFSLNVTLLISYIC